jgi:DNA polymerase V
MPSTNPSDEFIALIDCNNFFVSCEAVFNPKLKQNPTVVLSNNDGCVVSRSNLAKKVGIPMGAPIHKYLGEVKYHNIQVLSANFVLYGDLSSRVMEVLRLYDPNLEVYSIDEAFITLKGDPQNLHEQAREIKTKIMKWVGIPVSIGVARTKTQAKLAAEIGKKSSQGIKIVTEQSEWEGVFKTCPVEEIWGIGRKLKSYLSQRGIYYVCDLVNAQDSWIREHLTIVGLRTVNELRGIKCYEINNNPSPRKTIISSRSFGSPVETLDELSEAVASYIHRASVKLREDESIASFVSVYITTNRFSLHQEQYSNSIQLKLPLATDYTPMLITTALRGLKMIYKEGFKYKKAGICLSGIKPNEGDQANLFTQKDVEKETRLMKLMDSVNKKIGSHKLRFAAEGLGQNWSMRASTRSKRMTSLWNELLEVKV